MKYGKVKPGDDEATDRTRTLVRTFIEDFTTRNGSINCTELLGYNLNNPEEYEKARGNGLFVTKCPEFVWDAVSILEHIL